MMLGKFEDRKSMDEANERFLRALFARPADPLPGNDEYLACGHESRHAYRIHGEVRCRRCRGSAYDQYRRRNLPEMIETTKTKLEHLETEARRRGLIR